MQLLSKRTPAAALVAALAVLLGMAPAAAAEAVPPKRVFANPPVLGEAAAPPIASLLKLPAPGPRRGSERLYDLTIKYVDSTLYNPATGLGQPVHLRTYVGTDTSPDRPFIAPTIEAAPGDTVRVNLKNRLPADPDCFDATIPTNTPHCFNGTNLHSHGLWVSPTGNSDNVLVKLLPGVDFQYEYNIPPDHPSGTFWYHPHLHGSTALQVSSGMAGALIVRGDRKPTETVNGDLDTLLVKPDGGAMPEQLLVFQQIQYACTGADGKIKVDADGNVDWTCLPGEVGVIESYDQFGPGTWAASGRWTSINGVVLPEFRGPMAGQAERWRLVHAGVRETITVQFRKVSRDVGPVASLRLKASDSDRFVEESCGGAPVPYQIVASDGLTMAQAQTVTATTLQPGYRNDLLVVFPEPGRYCISEVATSAAGNVSEAASGREILGFVEVSDRPKDKAPVTDVTKALTEQLVAAAQKVYAGKVRDEVIAGLKDGLKLTRFVPHPTIEDSEVQGGQKLVFFINTYPNDPTTFEVGQDFDVVPDANGNLVPEGASPYDPTRIDRKLPLGGVQEWELRSYFVSHPFHIHVNPFQIVKILDPNGKDVSVPGAVDDSGQSVADPQYPGLKGVWKDTLWVKSLITSGLTNPPAGEYKIFIRTRYRRYIGEFVLHCHILDHEDQGMMQNISIVLPDGQGGTAHGHGHGQSHAAAKP
ncbi:multicopper oxidase family protein [Skermanella sp. TT6]|nr:multicopper oxidase domain-containing protein [Skermanella sp. TT6]